LFGSATKTYRAVLTDFFKGKEPLLNQRFVAYNHDSTSVPEAVNESGANSSAYAKLAAYLMVTGGFNVNSTSENAWKSVLACLEGASIESVLGVDAAKKDRYPALRVRRPAEKNIDDAAVPGHQIKWQGYRRLTKSQIDQLAKEIVKEIRTRGPYLSLADFVNRRVGAESDETNIKGALQAAIDRTTINAAILTTEGKEIAAADVAVSGYKSVKAGIGNTAANAPGVISQGDILSAIGSRITVRADTFRIRSYGEVRDGTGKRIVAKAWCEAVVQRIPEFVDPADLAHAKYAELRDVNKRFGRRYQIVSFRWLGPKEV
jgi:hypothetical protein